MSTTAAVPDKKGIVSSLSADAAEFVPLAVPLPEGATVKAGVISDKGGASAPVQVRDVPQFLTSCFPFVQLDGEIRTDGANQFSLPLQFPGIPHTVPMPSPAPVRMPAGWQSLRPELMGGFPPQPGFGSLPYLNPLATAVSLAQERPQGEGLLPTPVGLPLPGLHNSPGLILAAQPGHLATAPWLLTSAPPPLVPQPSQSQQHQRSVFIPSQQQLQQQHQPSLVSVPSTTVTTVTTSSSSSVSSSMTSPSPASKTTTSCAVDNRASSPVYISRSAQTYLPKQIHNFPLKEKPHPLYTRNHSKHKHKPSNEQDQDSDSGYSSPLQAKKLVSCGTQVYSAALSPRLVNSETKEARSIGSSKTAAGSGSGFHRPHGTTDDAADGDDTLGREVKKKTKKKKEHRAGSARSPHSLGSTSKLLSRSSSSISSAGTRPEDDDEKIDLHSWTDFPPMMPKSGAASVVGRSALSPTLAEGQADRVALTIERTAHAPPWTIKYTGSSNNGSRSSSMEKEKSSGLVTAGVQLDAGSGHTKSSQGSKPSKSPTGVGQIQGSNSSIGSKVPATVHKPNSTSATVITLNSSPAVTAITTTATASTSRSTTPSQANKCVPYSQIIKGTSPALGMPNPGYSMMFPPTTALPGTNPAAVFTVPSGMSTPGQIPLSVPPPPVNKQHPVTAARLPPPHMAFSGPPPNFRTPPPLLTSPQPTLNMASVHSSIPGIPVPPLYSQPPPPPPPSMFSQQHPVMRPNYPPPPVPGFRPQTHQRVTAPVSRPPAIHPNQWVTPPNLKPSAGYPGTTPQSREATPQINTSVKTSVPDPSAQASRSPQANVPSSKSSHTTPAPSNPPSETPLVTQQTTTATEIRDSEDKKRRRRRRRRGRGQGVAGLDNPARDGSPSLEHAISSSNVSESTLHFEDVDEFPDLVGAVRGYLPGEDTGADRATLSGTSLSYSDVIKATWSKASSQSRTQSLTGSCLSGDDEDNASNHTGTSNLSKKARKRHRRREQANKAAEVELAEISLEQQWLQQVGLRKSPTNAGPRAGLITNPSTVGEAKVQAGGKPGVAGGKKFQQPIAFDIAAMIDAIQKKPAPQPVQPSVGKSTAGGASGKSVRKDSKDVTGNVLDSTAPLQKRGKEREVPRTKKPSPLKKVILKEREQRKRLRLLDGDPDSASSIAGSKSGGVGMIGGESELSQEALSSKSEGTDEGEVGVTAELSADLSPISQTSPISMSPASPGNSGVSSPSAGSIGRDPVIMKIHSRRFREYCTQILDKEIDQCCTSLLQELVKFQDRMYHKDPVKAKSKRRVVLGLREVTKHLKLKRIKCVVISPNLEKIQSKGGLDEALNTILTTCQEQNVPFVFALGRRALGRACAKLVPVSVVGIFNYEGCESKYHSLISLTAAARDAYHEMVQAVEREVAEHPASQASSISGVPGLMAAHMGHSRTPSGCSAISFTSSILSEPISENFPHAEPEVDSKGYEIVRDAAGNVVHSQEGTSKTRSPNDIDDGNEADVEDLGEIRKKKRAGKNLNSVRFGSVGGASAIDEPQQFKSDAGTWRAGSAPQEPSTLPNSAENTMTQNVNVGSDVSSKGGHSVGQVSAVSGASADHRGDGERSEVRRGQLGEVTLEGSPVSHIDSIHSRSYNLGEAILSQHTSLPQADVAGGSPGFQVVQNSSPRSASTKLPSSLENSPQGKNGNEDDDEDVDDDLRISAVDDDSNDDNYEDDEDEDDDNEDNDNDEDNEDEEENEDIAEPVRSHQRIIDKQRIESWIESQTTVVPED